MIHSWNLIVLFVFLFLNFEAISQEKSANQTYNYQQLIEEYKILDQEYEEAELIEVGLSDNGKPIHLFVLSIDRTFDHWSANSSNKTIVFINNGIHPGEACGIEASLNLAKDIVSGSEKMKSILDSVIVLIVPIYNVGGMLNRGSYSRVSQNGPKEHGFRGNAKNLDLNRDFIKCDSRNARTFSRIFRKWNPDIFVDTHTTNGSDHSYTLTLIATQKDKLNPVLSNFLYNEMLDSLKYAMKSKGNEMVPYIYPLRNDPKDGIKSFLESPRYSSGYAALFDCLSFISEAHSYKSYEKRLEHTQAFLQELLLYSLENTAKIKKVRKQAIVHTLKQKRFTISWELDSNQYEELPFKGYNVKKRYSNLLEDSIEYYDRNDAYLKNVPHYSSYKSKIEVQKPTLYIIPKAYTKVLELLKINGIEYDTLDQDELINVEVYYIESYESTKQPYEGHYLHTNIRASIKEEGIQFYRGDVVVPTNQVGVRYVVETLEPESVDGFFAWNFFDGILQQKEWFSNFLFEPKAVEILKSNDSLRTAFIKKKESDHFFSKSAFAQLYYIYKNSNYYEPTVNRYPVYRFK